jgi:hypothetical protein
VKSLTTNNDELLFVNSILANHKLSMKLLEAVLLVAFVQILFAETSHGICSNHIKTFVSKFGSLKDKVMNGNFILKELEAQNPQIRPIFLRNFFSNATSIPVDQVCNIAKTMFGERFIFVVTTLPALAHLGDAVENVDSGSNCGDRIVKFRGFFFFFKLF